MSRRQAWSLLARALVLLLLLVGVPPLSAWAGEASPKSWSRGGAEARAHTEVHTYFVAGEVNAPAVWVHNMCDTGRLARMKEVAAAGRTRATVDRGTVSIFHGSFDNATGIIEGGLNRANPGGIWVSIDPRAAANAVAPGRLARSRPLDPGLFRSKVSRADYEQHFLPHQDPYEFGFLNQLPQPTTQIRLTTPTQVDLLNRTLEYLGPR